MQSKPTLYHLSEIDLESVHKERQLMRGTCVQAIIELPHAEKSREDLTCVSTDFYSLIIENKFTEAKKLLYPEEESQAGRTASWDIPTKRILASAQSRILIIPCHATNHWFLALRIKQKKGTHQVILIDSLGKKSGNSKMPKLRERLKQLNLITKKDRCTVLDTKIQTENECGIRMVAYMVLYRYMDIPQLKDTQILQKLNWQVATEKSFPGNLAAHRRTTIHRLLENEQALMKK